MKKLIVILAVITMVGALTATAMADVELYGSARFRTYYQSVDDGTPGADSDDDLSFPQRDRIEYGALNLLAEHLVPPLDQPYLRGGLDGDRPA